MQEHLRPIDFEALEEAEEEEEMPTLGVGKIHGFHTTTNDRLICLCRMWTLYEYVSSNRDRKNAVADGLNRKAT